MECQFCKGEGNSRSISQHIIRCKYNPNKIEIKNNFKEYNDLVKKGEIEKKNTNQFVRAKNEGNNISVSEETKNKLRISSKKLRHTVESKEKISASMKLAVIKYADSYSASNINGRTKKIEYKGFIMDGSWELEVAKWMDNNKIEWTKKITGFEYEYKGKRIYYPDFYLPTYDIYFEVKGFIREKDIEKWKVVENLIILKKDEINKIKKNIDPSKMINKDTIGAYKYTT